MVIRATAVSAMNRLTITRHGTIIATAWRSDCERKSLDELGPNG